jgi:penicillin amidase
MVKANGAIARLLLRKAWPQTRGRISGIPLLGEVEILRDPSGIPHIFAKNMRDLFTAQGFVHAQDRIWQMEALRRLSEGRLSEIAGAGMVAIDYFARMMGMREMKQRCVRGLSEDERGHFQAYADGVNAYLKMRGGDLPLEFGSMKLLPEPYTVADCSSALPYLSWFLAFTPYAEKLLAVMRGGDFTSREWNDMFPVSPGAALQTEEYFDSLARLKFGPPHPAAFAFHGRLTGKRASEELQRMLLSPSGGGSNNWAVAKASDGFPMLANDPHLGVSLPAIWYFCHLCVPGEVNTAGSSIAGFPGIVLGRNERVAWAMTNVMLDVADLFVLRVDPANPTRYRIGDRTLEMEMEEVVIGLPAGKSVTLPLYRTERGPVITGIEKGVEAAAVVRWHGTVPEEMLVDRTFRGVLTWMKAGSAAEVLDAGRHWRYASQNLLAADDRGHIGVHATGAVPLRKGYSGRMPADGSAGADWIGFLPYEAMPQRMDPAEGMIVTANYRPAGFTADQIISHSWCPPYRLERIMKALSAMQSPGVDDFLRLQMDVHSEQAERLLPKVLAHSFKQNAVREAARLLSEWDREVKAESRGAAVYEVFLVELERELLEKSLGEDLELYFVARLYGLENEILDRPDSPLWTRAGGSTTVENALCRTIAFCRKRMGRDPRNWRWGRLHRHVFRHPGAGSRLSKKLLNPEELPAHGDNNTVNVSWCTPVGGSFDVTTIPSLRMVVPLGDVDGMRIIGPLGQSGQPGHPHYNDMTGPWTRGETVPLPLSRQAVEKIAADRLVLSR